MPHSDTLYKKSNAERNKRLLPSHRYAWITCNTKEEEGRKSEYKIIWPSMAYTQQQTRIWNKTSSCMDGSGFIECYMISTLLYHISLCVWYWYSMTILISHILDTVNSPDIRYTPFPLSEDKNLEILFFNLMLFVFVTSYLVFLVDKQKSQKYL